MNFDINFKIFSFTRTISISKKWLQFGIVAATVFGGMVAAYWGSLLALIVLIAVGAGIAGLITLMRYPPLGIILIFIAGMLIPFEGPGGFNASVVTVILLMVLWFMDMFVVKQKFQFVKSRAIPPAFFFMLISIFAFVLGQIPWFLFANQAPLDAQIGGFAIYFFLVGTMIMAANVLTEIRWLKAVVWIFIGLGAFYVLGRTLDLSFIELLYQRGATANSMLWTWLVALSLSQAIFNTHLKLRWRILLYGIVLMTFYVAMIQTTEAYNWKSGWVPPAVAVVCLVGLRYKKLTFYAIPFAFFAGIYLARDLISTDVYSWGTRIDAWLIVLEISRTSPIFGLGFANYYWYTKLFPIRGYFISFNSHSQFVDLVAQTGIAGLLCFLWIFFEVGRLSWDLSKKVTDGFSRGYVNGVLAGALGSLMAAYLVDWVLPFTYNIGLNGVRTSILPWIFFGGLVTVEQIYLANEKIATASIRERLLRFKS